MEYKWKADDNTTETKFNPYSTSSYKFLTRSSPYRRGSSSSTRRFDELELCLKFDVNSLDLPTKIQLEITDSAGRTVFQKRQNIYYVKIQEKLATLGEHKKNSKISTTSQFYVLFCRLTKEPGKK